MAATLELANVKIIITDDMTIQCDDITIKSLVESYLEPGGPSGADPNPPHTLAMRLEEDLGAKIINFDPKAGPEIVEYVQAGKKEHVTVKIRRKGGPGSGNWGHSGRPGFVGGAAPRSSAMSQAQYSDGLSDAQRQVIRRYTGGDFTYMNKHLRTGSSTSESIKTKISILQETLTNAPPIEQKVLYRYVSGKPEDFGYEAGSIVREAAFMSTSKHIPKMSTGIVLKLNIAPKAKGLDVSYNNIAGKVHKSENEVLLAAGHRLHIKSVTLVPEHEKSYFGGLWHIEADLLPPK